VEGEGGWGEEKIGKRMRETPAMQAGKFTYLNKTVRGIRKFPRIACRYGGVLVPFAAKTTSTPLMASLSPTRKNSR